MHEIKVAYGSNKAAIPLIARKLCKCTAVCLLCGSLLATGSAQSPLSGEGHADNQSQDSDEHVSPEVTPEEAQRLEKVHSIGEENPQEAIQRLKDSLGEDTSAAVYYTLGSLYARKKNFVAAEKHLQKAVDRFSPYPTAERLLADVLLKTGKPSEASDYLLNLTEQPSVDRATVWRKLGDAFLREGLAVKAETALRKALLYSENGKRIRRLLIKALLAQDRFSEAKPLILAELKKDPGNKNLWRLRINHCVKNGDQETALQLLTSMQHFQLLDRSLILLAAELYASEGYPHAALTMYERAANLEEIAWKRLLHGFQTFLATDRIEEAAALHQTLQKRRDKIDKDNQKARFLFLCAQLAEMREQEQKARRLYRNTLKKDPLHGKALIRLSTLLRDAQAFDDALHFLARAERVEEVKAESLRQQAYIAVERGNYGKAEKRLEKSLKIEDSDSVRNYLKEIRQYRNRVAQKKEQQTTD